MADDEARTQLVERIATAAGDAGFTVAVAESLTGGQIAAALSAGPSASDWFRGGVVAYSPEVKFEVLGVEPGPVVTQACAEQMASGVAELTGASAAVAVTGVGGPDPEESQPAGTVWMAVCADGAVRSERLRLTGEPPEILGQTVNRALAALADASSALATERGGPS